MTYTITITVHDNGLESQTKVDVPNEMPLLHIQSIREAYDIMMDKAKVKIQRRGMAQYKDEVDNFLKTATIKDLE